MRERHIRKKGSGSLRSLVKLCYNFRLDSGLAGPGEDQNCALAMVQTKTLRRFDAIEVPEMEHTAAWNADPRAYEDLVMYLLYYRNKPVFEQLILGQPRKPTPRPLVRRLRRPRLRAKHGQRHVLVQVLAHVVLPEALKVSSSARRRAGSLSPSVAASSANCCCRCCFTRKENDRNES